MNMNKEYKLTQTLKLVSFPVQEEVKQASGNIHHLWILDRSGSMYGVLPKVIEDMKRQVRTLQKGDALTFAYFSSKGQYGFPIKLFRIVDESSYKELDKLFDQHKSTLGMTCFSEVLGETIQTVKDAEFLNLKTSALFFSDGYANSPSQSQEYTKVREIMPKLGQVLDMFLTVAHSNYSDKQFLAEMAELCGGESVGSDSLESFTRIMDKFLRSSSMLTPRQVVKVDIPSKDIKAIFSFGDDIVNSFTPREDGLVQSSKNVWTLINEDNITGAGEFAPIEAQYASALVLARKGQVDLALEILNSAGDKYLIDKLNNAFTPAERGSVEDDIKEAVFNSDKRYLDGKVHNYLPDPNTFCILDLIELLSNDSQARFYPRHPDFKYNSIGRKPIMKEGYEKFNAYLENSCPISQFNWNKELLNLSILATVKGTVKLKDKVEIYKEVDVSNKKNGEKTQELFGLINKPKTLGDIKESFQWKNYTLIKDGFLNITKLPISASVKTLFKLQNEGLIPSVNDKNEFLEVGEKYVYTLDLTSIPIINKSIVSKDVTAKELLNSTLQELSLQAQIKVLNSLRKELAPDAPKVQNNWTEEEREFLLVSGFRDDGSYSPPSELEESTDVYDAVAFKIGIKGLSSFPSLKDMRERLTAISTYATENNVKKQPELTFAMSLMVPTLNEFDYITKSLSTKEKVQALDKKLDELKFILNKVRKTIQSTKFNLVLGHKSFTDLETSEAEQIVKFTPLPHVVGNMNPKELTGVIKINRKEIKI